jgi:hypothetical protein
MGQGSTGDLPGVSYFPFGSSGVRRTLASPAHLVAQVKVELPLVLHQRRQLLVVPADDSRLSAKA